MQRMRDVLRSSLGRSLRELSPADRLQAAWQVACGAAMAGQAEILELDGEGVLHVVVHQTAWVETFRGMRSALANDLARIAGVPVREIHFENRSGAAPVRRKLIRPASQEQRKEADE